MTPATGSTLIVGAGAATPLGFTAGMGAAAVRANCSRFRESPWVDKNGEPMVVSIANYLDSELRAVDRLVELALMSAQEATAQLRTSSSYESLRIPLLVACAPVRPGFDSEAQNSFLTRFLDSLGPQFDAGNTQLFPNGHAGAFAAVSQGIAMVTAGSCDFVLAGGVESYYDADTLEWLDSIGRLHSEANLDGFVPGEGAAFVLLASYSAARRWGLPAFARVLSSAAASEPHPSTSDGICIGQGLTEAIRAALESPSPQSAGKIADWTLCDLNGETFRAMEWVYAYLRTGARHRDPLQIWHPADCLGDLGAASGGVLFSLAIEAWRRKYARGNRCLMWTSSDAGLRAAVLLRGPEA